MSEANRYAKLGHLVKDTSGGHLVNDDAGAKHLVKVDSKVATYTRNPAGDVSGYSSATSFTSMEDAVSLMQDGSHWVGTANTSVSASASTIPSYSWFAQCAYIGYDIFLPSTRTLVKAKINISALSGSPTWLIYWQQGTFNTDWSWVTANDPVSGTTTGDFDITIGAACTSFVYFFIMLSAYTTTNQSATLNLPTVTLYV